MSRHRKILKEGYLALVKAASQAEKAFEFIVALAAPKAEAVSAYVFWGGQGG